MPDKAIDLVDQACATIRTEMGSNPTELDQVNRRVMQLEIEEIKSLEKEKADKEMEEKILRYVTGETYRWSYLLQEVRLLMPVDIKVDQLSFNPEGEFSLQGSATDHRSVALFLANLKNSKMLQLKPI